MNLFFMLAMNDTCFWDSHRLTNNISMRSIKKLIDDAPRGFGFYLRPHRGGAPPECDRTDNLNMSRKSMCQKNNHVNSVQHIFYFFTSSINFNFCG